jgi:APA family basic amino acid/polyamine antiporter
MMGARAYAEVARIVPRSGGEYRYLSDLIHPALGYFAGWTSLLAGFSAPVASNAAVAGPYTATLIPGVNPTFIAAALVVLVTLMHALDVSLSKWSQDLLALTKFVLIIGFIAMGLIVGNHTVPEWEPFARPAICVSVDHCYVVTEAVVGNYMAQMVFVMYAYSGWNAAVYAAEDFKDPEKTIPRSMVIGVAVVTLMYVLVNYVLVANLSEETVFSFLEKNKEITFGHVVTTKLLGEVGGKVMSIFVVLALFSAMSAMTMVGPRVYEAMARDGFLPKMFIGKQGKPPVWSVLLQGAIALALVLTHAPDDLLANVSIILTLTSVITVVALFKVRLFDRDAPKQPSGIALAAALGFVAVSGWMLVSAIAKDTTKIYWSTGIAIVAAVAYVITRKLAPDATRPR